MYWVWDAEAIKQLTLEEKLEWFDTYNFGLLEDRGFAVDSLTEEKKKEVAHSIQEEYLDYLMTLSDNPNFVCYIVYKDGVIRSQLRIIKLAGKYFIEGLETHRDYRKMGYGSAILQYAIAYAKKIGIKELYSMISNQNIASIRTHEKCGFEQITDDVNKVRYVKKI